MTGRRLVVRLDSMGDVLVCGPAVRAVANGAKRVTMLVGPRGEQAARLLPGVDQVLVWDCPWIAYPPPATHRVDIMRIARLLDHCHLDSALILTSFHQSALPTALLLRLAGIDRIAAVSTDYAGDLLTDRLADPPDAPEPVRMLDIARAAGYHLLPSDHGRLRVVDPGPPPPDMPTGPFVVVHPGADAPAREYPAALWREVVARLTAGGRTVVVTGGPDERELAHTVAGPALDLAGRTDVAGLAAVLAAADVVVAANTGPAHLAAAVGTPVVSLFAPVVPMRRWAPYGVPTRVLGDQFAACAGTRARECPVAGHPCLTSVQPADVCAAVAELADAFEAVS